MKEKVGIYKIYSDNAKEVKRLLIELSELRKQEDAIIEKLKEISRNLNEGEEKRNLKALKDLGLSTYVYNVLRKAGFSTVTDIIVFPESKWRNVYHLGKKSAKELETKMRNIGYPDFTIEF